MKYQTEYKGAKIVVQPAEVEDWTDRTGYEVIVHQKGCKPATSWNNYENAVQALSFAKKSIDEDSIPRERQKFLGIF